METWFYSPQRGEMCVHLLPVLEKMYSESPLSKDDYIIYYTEYCFAAAFKELGDSIDDATIQRHIDAFLKRGIEDDYQQTPGTLFHLAPFFVFVSSKSCHLRLTVMMPHRVLFSSFLSLALFWCLSCFLCLETYNKTLE